MTALDALEREPEQDDGSAPWVPYRLAVGQRVRVRLSGECQEHVTRHHESVLHRVDGVTGVVRATDDVRERDHPYHVTFDETIATGRLVRGWRPGGEEGVDRVVVGGLFALAELELLDPAEPATREAHDER